MFFLSNFGYSQEKTTFSIGPSINSKIVTNKFSDIRIRSVKTYLNKDYSQISNHFSTNYPFIKRIQIAGAIGGSVGRDLFINPLNRNDLNDYNFTTLIEACKRAKRQNLIPVLNLTAVPLKLSKNPFIGSFGVNVRQPKNYDTWNNYIQAIIYSLVKEFGKDELRNWSWEFGLEYENKNWFNAGTPDSTKEAFFKIYDYGVAALEKVFGDDHFLVGVHCMAGSPGYWDELTFFDHITKEQNYSTGKIGTKIDFVSISFYNTFPSTFDTPRLLEVTKLIKSKILDCGCGLNDIKFGINEGQILYGWDKKQLRGHVVQHPIQGPAEAKFFKAMVDQDIDYCSIWEDNFNEPVSLCVNTVQLLSRMVNENLLETAINTSSNKGENNEFDGLATYNKSTKILHFYVYNNNNDQNSIKGIKSLIKIKGIELTKDKALLTKWTIDEDHSNWWKQWTLDSKEIPDSLYADSKYAGGSILIKKEYLTLWKGKVKEYQKTASLVPESVEFEIKDNEIDINVDLQHHSFMFFELKGVTFLNK